MTKKEPKITKIFNVFIVFTLFECKIRLWLVGIYVSRFHLGI
jgi:hypothetical protein